MKKSYLLVIVLIILALGALLWFFILKQKTGSFNLPSVNPLENFKSANPYEGKKINPFENVYKNPFE